MAGEKVVTLALHDVAAEPVQWVSGGAVADAVIARDGGAGGARFSRRPAQARGEANLASTPIAELHLDSGERTAYSSDDAAGLQVFAQAIEEWKLLIAIALAGLSREAVRLAAAYACERVAFGQPIGTYQGISHPLADLITDIDGGKYFTWKAIHDIAKGLPDAGAQISLALWWNADTASRAVVQSLHTFGGYGLTTEYDIHLYNLRAKAWPLVFGDPSRLLEEAGRRLYAGEAAQLPDVGEVSIDFDLGDEARGDGRGAERLFQQHADARTARQGALLLRRLRCRRAPQAGRGEVAVPGLAEGVGWPGGAALCDQCAAPGLGRAGLEQPRGEHHQTWSAR